MSRSPDTKRRHLQERLERQAARARAEQAAQDGAGHVAQIQARIAEPANPLSTEFMRWNQFMHLPAVWAALAAKPLYAITADEVACLLADTIRAAAFDGVVGTEPDALQVVARRALPLAARFESAWRDYWRNHS